jgi:hypothetical protein
VTMIDNLFTARSDLRNVGYIKLPIPVFHGVLSLLCGARSPPIGHQSSDNRKTALTTLIRGAGTPRAR